MGGSMDNIRDYQEAVESAVGVGSLNLIGSVSMYLKAASDAGASDIFILAGKEISMKKDGVITPIREGRLEPGQSEHLVSGLYAMAERPKDKYLAEGDDDFAVSVPGMGRFRINAYKQRGSMAAVVRVVKFGIPDSGSLGIPEGVMAVAKMSRGLVLVTGPAGSGKSTTLACIVDAMNRTRNAHIVTIEDPIEYLHRNDVGIVSQRELSMDTLGYAAALRASLRQAPDAILVGEMRDAETMRTAMTAAETGHLVISTLHTLGAANAVDRIIDSFPPEQQHQARVQLAQVLRAVISQQLLPGTGGGLVPAFEIMRANDAIRSMIRDDRSHQMDSVIRSSKNDGMMGMDDCIYGLVKAGRVSADTAVRTAMDPDKMRLRAGAQK